MTLLEYIEKREEALDNQIDEVMSKETINTAALMVINSAIAELEKIKTVLEDGIIEV